MVNTLIIMRGLPGSGKSTIALDLAVGRESFVDILSSDDFFMKNGEYKFDADKLGEAHQWNQTRARVTMHQVNIGAWNDNTIIIDNTNTRKWEMAPYEEAALEHGWDVEYITVGRFNHESIEKYYKRGTHNVPRRVLIQMAERFER